KLPDGMSLQAGPIQSALSEGRTEDAKTLIVAILLSGRADKVTQELAAAMIKPTKRPRGRKSALTRHWFDIGSDFHHLRACGDRYEDALAKLSKKYGYSETHIRKAISEYDSAKHAADEASRD
ncbi:hypothetical protein, partial [Rhizobium rosettiformans]